MAEPPNFEYIVLQHYLHKGIWARAGIIDLLIRDLRQFSGKESRNNTNKEFDLNDNEIISTLQIAIISNLMMLIEDLAIICKSILEGKIDYYKFLDKSGDEELGKVIGNFYSEINTSSTEDLSKILSYADPKSFEFVLEEEQETVLKIKNQMIDKVRIFFNRITLFSENHRRIFRRYKHAGFPILLAQPIPPVLSTYSEFEFASLGLTSREKIEGEIVPIPFSAKAIESYESLKKDIFSFLGNVIHFKMICINNKVDGLIPHKDNLFSIILTEDEKKFLDNVWKRFNSKFPVSTDKFEIGFETLTEILRWYEDIDDNSKRVL